MILVIDAGNTRVKWGVVQHGQWLAEGAVMHAEVAALGQVPLAHPALSRVVGANVAGAAMATRIAAALEGAAPQIEWIRPTAQCCGVRNLYEQPDRLGADRWAALIGARAVHRGAPCLVVTAGTATTVDMLDADGVFAGGVILPGEELMRRALAGNTAQLPFAEGQYRTTPRNTADAIVSGCLTAQLGAIELMFRRIEHPEALCLLNGGAAARLDALLTIPFRRIDNLVLKGLARIAACDGDDKG